MRRLNPSAAASLFQNSYVFQSFDMMDKRVFVLSCVLPGIARPPTSLSLADLHRLYFGGDKRRAVLRQIFLYRRSELFFTADRAGLLNTASSGDSLEVHGTSGGRGHSRLAATRPARQIVSIVENDDQQIARFLIGNGSQAAEV